MKIPESYLNDIVKRIADVLISDLDINVIRDNNSISNRYIELDNTMTYSTNYNGKVEIRIWMI